MCTTETSYQTTDPGKRVSHSNFGRVDKEGALNKIDSRQIKHFRVANLNKNRKINS